MDDRMVLWLVIPGLVLVVGIGRFVRDALLSHGRRSPFPGVPVSKVAGASMTSGQVQCIGKVVASGELVPAPIRGRAVAFTRLDVHGRHGAHAAAPQVALFRRQRWASFTLEDASGRIAVDADSARVDFDDDRHVPRQFTTNLVGPPSPELAAWIDSQGLLVDPDGHPFPHLQVTEWVINVGDEVAVVGRVQNGAGPYRGTPVLRIERLHLLGPKES